MIKIVIDAFGGDNAPFEIVKGAVSAVNKNANIHIVLSGKEEALKEELNKYTYNLDQISIINASEVISNDESPTTAIKTKKDSSLVRAFDYVNENDDAVGLISAGSTGAVLTGGFLKFGRIKGVLRPALCPVFGTITGDLVSICDSGANMDCKPQYLEQFAVMASAYLKTLGKENPRVALLNVGTEDHKGDLRSKEAFALLKENKFINFVGNMEARDLLSGNYDVVVTDGFAGNVLLKSTEGAMLGLLGVIKSEVKSSFRGKMGGLILKPTFKKIKDRFDYSNHGGAVLLGCKKLLVKAHGSSKAKSIEGCINQIASMAEGKLIESITESVSKMGIKEDD